MSAAAVVGEPVMHPQQLKPPLLLLLVSAQSPPPMLSLPSHQPP